MKRGSILYPPLVEISEWVREGVNGYGDNKDITYIKRSFIDPKIQQVIEGHLQEIQATASKLMHYLRNDHDVLKVRNSFCESEGLDLPPALCQCQ